MGRKARTDSAHLIRALRCRDASGFPDSPRRPAVFCASAGSSPHAMPSGATTRRSARCGLRSAFPRPRRARSECRSSGTRIRRCRAPRRVGRGRRRHRVRRAGRHCDRRARRVDRGQRSASASSVPSGSIDAPCHSVRGAGHVRPAALGFVAQLRARRGFVRSRAVGGAPFRLEHLSPAAGGALAEARRVPRALDRRTRIGAGGGAVPLSRAWNGAPDAIDAAWRDFALARPALDRHAEVWAAELAELPTWRRDWSRQPCIWYN